MAYIDMTGQRFGRVTVIKKVTGKNKSRTYWQCKCDCGNEFTTTRQNLIQGATKSCGCYNKELSTKHGMYGTKIYRTWSALKSRCTNSNNHQYKNYGGRGISLFEDWFEFDSFYQWAINNGYDDSLSIDRIDNDGNYEPSNCHWTDMKEQSNNRRTNRLVTINGETKTVSQWIDFYSLNKGRVWHKVSRGNNDAEAILYYVNKR